MFRIWLSIAVIVLSVAGTAQADRGLRPAERAGKYIAQVVKQKVASEYELAWQSLYPPHQRVAPLDAYVACESLVPDAGTLIGIRVLRTFAESIRIAGEPVKRKTRAVRVRILVASPYFTLFPIRIVQTFHAIAVAGQWRWILSPQQFEYYRAGTCPYA